LRAIRLEELEIGYLHIPKTASSSIKSGLITLIKGEPHNIKNYQNIHRFFRKRKLLGTIDDLSFKFIVIRDPVKRFLSALNNRVYDEKELSEEYLEKKHPRIFEAFGFLNIPFNPNLDQFLQYFKTYQRIPTIYRHFIKVKQLVRPYKDLSLFDRVYTLKTIKELETDLKDILDLNYHLPKENKARSNKYKLIDLKEYQLEQIIDWYQEDYQIMEKWFTPDEIRKEYREQKNITH